MSCERQSPELVIAEDDQTAKNLLLLLARQEGLRVAAAPEGQQAVGLIGTDTKAMLLDLRMPNGWDGFRTLEHMATHHPGIPVIVLTSANAAADAVKALKLGAIDYLTKPYDPEELFAVLHRAFELWRLRRENETLKDAVGVGHEVSDMVAASTVMIELMDKVRKVAVLDSSILLTGESGVGKGMMARLIHGMSFRSAGPFGTVSCPALPRELLESELFGHEKGSFTGALRRRIGKIEAAAGGTLFLDEIGELPLELQPKLLSVLQERQFQRIGGEAVIKANVRVVAASNVNFEDKIAKGLFREDLFFRLNVIPLEIPPLRKRRIEIAPLCHVILSKIAKARGKEQIAIAPEAMLLLERHSWPGNVRELENTLERCSAFCDKDVIRAVDVLPVVGTAYLKSTVKKALEGLAGFTLDEIEREAIQQTLELSRGNRLEAARRLGISERTIYNKLKGLV